LPSNGSPSTQRIFKHRRRIDTPQATEQLDRIYIRDVGICQLCFKICERDQASRDHIKELKDCISKKEARSDDNVRLAHIVCNNLRSNTRLGLETRQPTQKRKRRYAVPITQSLADQLQNWEQHNLTHESD
jgi:5-methylcytosine-specific restriction endonuclease McrA